MSNDFLKDSKFPDDEYYNNKFLVCQKCKSNPHIMKLILNEQTIKYKCKCGTFIAKIEEFIYLFTFFLKKENSTDNIYSFNNINRNNPIKLERLNSNCTKHNTKRISFCHECSENLCNKCFNYHKKHVLMNLLILSLATQITSIL